MAEKVTNKEAAIKLILKTLSSRFDCNGVEMEELQEVLGARTTESRRVKVTEEVYKQMDRVKKIFEKYLEGRN